MIELAPIKHVLLTISLILPRMIALFSVVPFLNSQILQGMVRNSILVSFALIVFPMVSPSVPPEIASTPLLVAIIAKEILIGIIMGYLVGIMFWAVESIGFFIDNQRGTTMASVMDPMTGAQTSPFGSMLLQVITVLFFTSGGFLTLLGGIFESYRLWPIYSFFPKFNADFPLFFLQQSDLLMEFTVLLAAPIIIAVFVSEFGLGLINRFSPQLNVFFLSMPIKSAVASFLLILYFTTLIGLIKSHLLDVSKLLKFIQAVIQ